MSLSGEEAKQERVVGTACTELLYAVAELRSAASRDDIDNRALLYNLADSLELAASRLQGAGEDASREPVLQENGN